MFRIFNRLAGAFKVQRDVRGLEQLLLAVWVDALRAGARVSQEDCIKSSRVAVNVYGDVFGGPVIQLTFSGSLVEWEL